MAFFHSNNSIEKKIFLMFLVLISFIIINGIFSTYRWKNSTAQKIEKDLQHKLAIADSVLKNELDKFDDLSFIVKEQKTKVLELIDFDDYRGINTLFQRLSSLYDVDIILLFDEAGELLASNKFITQTFNKNSTQSLLHDLEGPALIEVVSPKLLQSRFPEYYMANPNNTNLCFKSVVKLVYDSGDNGGHIILLKFINPRYSLVTKMSRLSGAKIEISEKGKGPPILSNFNELDDNKNIKKNNIRKFSQYLQTYPAEHHILLSAALNTTLHSEQGKEVFFSNVIPFALTLLVSLYLFVFLKIRVFSKVGELIETLKKVTEGKLNVRLKSPHSIYANPDEITRMGINFNTMMDKLQTTYDELDLKTNEMKHLNDQLKDEIIERKNTEVALLEAKLEAEAANQSKSLFLANMSHEIRTPMNAILGYSQIMQREKEITQTQREAINTIRQSGMHLLGLINDILDISKIEAGRMELKICNFDLMALLHDLSEMFKLRCLEQKLTWHLEVPSKLSRLVVSGDEGKIKQVLINLLGNAIKFTAKGKVILSLSILETHEYLFEVIDTGQGIPKAAQKKIFLPFQQDEEGINKGGTGLGLAISSKQLELMHSQLKVYSRPNEGARFYFKLHLMAAERFDDNTLKSRKEVLSLAPGCEICALIVDDIQVNREVLANILNHIGVHILTADCALKALTVLTEKQPDIIFMDYRMPDMNGIETVTEIRNKYANQHKIIMVSASVFDTFERFKQCGCDGTINKPYRIEEIYDCLAHLINAEFIYEESDTELEDNIEDPVSFTGLVLPKATYDALKEAAEFCLLTDLEELIEQLKSVSEPAKAFAQKIQQQTNNYAMDDIIELLESIDYE